MLELYQFELSPYSEKVRLILDYKSLDYKKVEVTPGIGQIEVYRMSGQKQVPLLKDGDKVIADSTAIAMYLDKTYPDRPIIPQEAKFRGMCLITEDWADEFLGGQTRKVLYGAISQSTNFRQSLLPSSTPDVLKALVGSIPSDFFNLIGSGIGLSNDIIKEAQKNLKEALKTLSSVLKDQPYLITDYPTLADLTVASLTIFLKFPKGDYLYLPEHLKGTGIPGIADNPEFDTFFNWRDQLYEEYRQPLTPPVTTDPVPPSGNPTTIEIE